MTVRRHQHDPRSLLATSGTGLGISAVEKAGLSNLLLRDPEKLVSSQIVHAVGASLENSPNISL